MKLFKKKNTGPVLSTEHAEQILFDVFDSCGLEKNTVPLEALLSYANYRKEKYTLQKSAIIIVLTLFMFLPILFVTAEIVIAVNYVKENSNPEYTVNVAPYIPVESIHVTMNGRTVPVTAVNSHEFVLHPSDSGEMSITVTLFNQQTSTDVISVVDVDSTQPTLVSVDTQNDNVVVTVRDDGSGLNLSAVRITDETGQVIPFTFDETLGTVTLKYPSSTVTMTVPDNRGNTLTVRLNP